MIVFRDLEAHGDHANVAAFAKALSARATVSWSYDASASARAKGLAGSNDEEWYSFVYRGSAAPPATLWLLLTRDNCYVPNITPHESGRLSHAEYNAILTSFADEMARPVAGLHNVSITLTDPEYNLENALAPDVMGKLRRFSRLANKSTGSSHPEDLRRWHDFIIAFHRNPGTVDAATIRRWLVEEEAWPEDNAHELQEELETGLELLKSYEANQ